MKLSALQWLWLGLTALGTAIPMAHLIVHVLQNGVGIGTLFDVWTATPAGKALTWDLMLSAIALICWICVEVYVRRNWEALIAIPATLLIGVSCGLPLYLYLRSRPIV